MSLYRDLDTLARTVLEIDDKVKDYLEAAAILEAVGVSKSTANRLGYPDVFTLAKDVMKVVEHYRLIGESVGEEKPTRLKRIVEAVKLFFSGVLLSSPWLIITLSYLLFGVALLPVYEEPLYATAIDFTLTLSIILTSFLQPTFMRKLLYYIYQEDIDNAQWITTVYYILGAVMVAVSASVLTIILNLSGMYPSWWPLYILSYFIPFSLFWLALAPLYALRRHYALALSYIISLSFIGAVNYLFGSENIPHVVHIYGILLGAFFAIIYFTSLLYVRSRITAGERVESTIPPKLSIVFYLGSGYAIAGTLYFLFIFIDRFLVWTMAEAYPILANLEYEKAANLSLLILAVPFGVMNYYLTKLYEEILKGGDRFSIKDSRNFAQDIKRYFLKACLAVLGAGALSYMGLSTLFFYLGWLPTAKSWFIYLFSGVSYVLLPAFFLGFLIGIFLYRPKMFLTSMSIGVGMNLILGFLLTRLIGYEYAAFSYALSSAVLAGTSILLTLKMLERIDYAYYSAF